MVTVIVAWSTDHIQADFTIPTWIVAWFTDHIQADFDMLTAILHCLQAIFKQISPCLL